MPVPTPETQPYWDGIAEEKVRITRCVDCSQPFFPPSPVCPNCSSQSCGMVRCLGSGHALQLRDPPAAATNWGTEGPRSVAIVELDEGPRLVSSVVDCEQTPEELQLDMALTATFVPFDEATVLCFRPAATTGGSDDEPWRLCHRRRLGVRRDRHGARTPPLWDCSSTRRPMPWLTPD